MSRKALTDGMQLAGLACIAVGVGWFSVPLGVIVAGVALVIAGGVL
jgi:hypothetical protein